MPTFGVLLSEFQHLLQDSHSNVTGMNELKFPLELFPQSQYGH